MRRMCLWRERKTLFRGQETAVLHADLLHARSLWIWIWGDIHELGYLWDKSGCLMWVTPHANHLWWCEPWRQTNTGALRQLHGSVPICCEVQVQIWSGKSITVIKWSLSKHSSGGHQPCPWTCRSLKLILSLIKPHFFECRGVCGTTGGVWIKWLHFMCMHFFISNTFICRFHFSAQKWKNSKDLYNYPNDLGYR